MFNPRARMGRDLRAIANISAKRFPRAHTEGDMGYFRSPAVPRMPGLYFWAFTRLEQGAWSTLMSLTGDPRPSTPPRWAMLFGLAASHLWERP